LVITIRDVHSSIGAFTEIGHFYTASHRSICLITLLHYWIGPESPNQPLVVEFCGVGAIGPTGLS